MTRWMRAIVCRWMLVAAVTVSTVTAGVVVIHYPLVAAVAVAAKLRSNRRRWRNSGNYGTARFCSPDTQKTHGMFGNVGLILGRTSGMTQPTRMEAVRAVLSPARSSEEACQLFLTAFASSRWMTRRLIRVKDGVHLSTVAPTGRGKSVSVLIPNLLKYSESCVVFDPAGELYRETASHRATAFGHKIIRLDPYGVCGPGGDSYNFLDHLGGNAPDLVEQCRDLADQLIVRTGNETEPHWNESACGMIASFVFMICLCERKPEDRNLQCLRDILSSRHKFDRAKRFLTQHEDGSTLRRLGDVANWLQDRELYSVMTTVQRHTGWMDTPLLNECMNRSTFDPRVLRTGRATLYLILPHNKLSTQQALLRTWIGSLMRVLTQPGGNYSKNVLFLLDEAAMLGRMKSLEEATTQYRKFGIKLWFFWQTLDQMKACFGDSANTIASNIDTFQFFGINDTDTAEAVSKRIGEETVVNVSMTHTTGWSKPTEQIGTQRQPGSYSGGTSMTTSELGRRVLKPEEILTLPEGMSLVFHKNLPVIPAVRVYHYADPEFKQGGTGTQPGLGVAAGILSFVMLLSSLAFAGVAFSVIPPPPGGWVPQRERMFVKQWLSSGALPGRGGIGTTQSNRPPGPGGSKAVAGRRMQVPSGQWTRRPRRPPTPLNQLIPIR